MAEQPETPQEGGEPLGAVTGSTVRRICKASALLTEFFAEWAGSGKYGTTAVELVWQDGQIQTVRRRVDETTRA